MIEDRPIYVDIDGTLTDEPVTHWGRVHVGRLIKLRRMIARGDQVVIWSGGGTAYAKAFAERHGLQGAICLGKPEIMVDDNPNIRPGGVRRQTPERFFA